MQGSLQRMLCESVSLHGGTGGAAAAGGWKARWGAAGECLWASCAVGHCYKMQDRRRLCPAGVFDLPLRDPPRQGSASPDAKPPQANSTLCTVEWLQGETVPYVICIEVGEDGQTLPREAKGLAERAYHPEEVKSNPALRVDTEYYLAQQVQGVCVRLCPAAGFQACVFRGWLAGWL